MHIYFDAAYNIVFKVHEVYISLYISFIWSTEIDYRC